MLPEKCTPFAYKAGEDASARFLELSRAFIPSRAFSTAVKLDLFTVLSDMQGGAGATRNQVAAKLGLKSDVGFRGTADFLDLMVALDCLTRDGEGPEARYRNTPDAEKYLSRHSPDFMGGIALINHNRSYPQLLFLEESLKTGVQPPQAAQLVHNVVDVFHGQAADAAATEEFALGMTGASKVGFMALASSFDFRRYTSLADFGGSAGTLCCCVVGSHPHLTATTYDLPAVHTAAVKYVGQQGLQDKVKVADLDIFESGAFPPADVITMSMILHDWGLEKKKELISKAYAALPAGGAFIAVDVLIDDARESNVWGLGMSLNMLVEFEGENAFDYSFKEFQDWVAEAGFCRTELLRLTPAVSAAVAYKP